MRGVHYLRLRVGATTVVRLLTDFTPLQLLRLRGCRCKHRGGRAVLLPQLLRDSSLFLMPLLLLLVVWLQARGKGSGTLAPFGAVASEEQALL